MKLTSPAFIEGDEIPATATTEDANQNPPLIWSEVPMEAISLVLLIEDAGVNGADSEPWVHWLIFNMPPTTTQILAGKPPLDSVEGISSAGSRHYAGIERDSFSGRHICTCTLYALDTELDVPKASNKSAVMAAMDGHIIDQATLSAACTGTK